MRAWDPVALEEARNLLSAVDLCSDPLDALRGADAAVVVTEWPELAELPFDKAATVMARRVIVDGRNLFDPQAVREAGFVYEGIGRPVPWLAPGVAEQDLASALTPFDAGTSVLP